VQDKGRMLNNVKSPINKPRYKRLFRNTFRDKKILGKSENLQIADMLRTSILKRKISCKNGFSI
jgi:hypothetical protein